MSVTSMALTLFLSQTVASAYLPFKMLNTETDPFVFYVDGRVQNPGGMPSAEFRASTERAWQKWEDLSCSVTASTSMGWTTSAIPEVSNPYDSFNVSSIWVSSPQDPTYASTLGTPDVTAMSLMVSYAGVLQQCDIYLNGADRRWSTSSMTPQDSVDLETVLLHESGHCQGLDHSPDIEDVMFAIIPLGEAKRSFSPQDVTSLCNRYPKQGAVGSPCPNGNADCGQNQKCVTPPVAAFGQGTPRCSEGCQTTAEQGCEAPWVCQLSSEFAPEYDGACLPPGNFATTVGKACSQASECQSPQALCVSDWPDGYCTQACSLSQDTCSLTDECTFFEGESFRCLKKCRLNGADCRPGYVCAPSTSGATGVCRPACESDSDCPNGTCRTCDGLCLSSSSEGNIGDMCLASQTCGAGQSCAFFGSTVAGVCTQACGTSCWVCPEGSLCQPVGPQGASFCLRECDDTKPCPAGLRCGLTATGRGCLPPCASDFDCPVGDVCAEGTCQTKSDEQDAGNPTPSTMPGEGCGCTQGPSMTDSIIMVWTGLTCVLRNRRRKT